MEDVTNKKKIYKERDALGQVISPMRVIIRGTKRLVSVNICSVEGNSAGIFVSKVPPGIFATKVK